MDYFSFLRSKKVTTMHRWVKNLLMVVKYYKEHSGNKFKKSYIPFEFLLKSLIFTSQQYTTYTYLKWTNVKNKVLYS